MSIDKMCVLEYNGGEGFALMADFSHLLMKGGESFMEILESRQVLYGQSKSELEKWAQWAFDNGLAFRLKEMNKRKLVGGTAYQWRLTVSGFKGKGGEKLLTEIADATGLRWHSSFEACVNQLGGHR